MTDRHAPIRALIPLDEERRRSRRIAARPAAASALAASSHPVVMASVAAGSFAASTGRTRIGVLFIDPQRTIPVEGLVVGRNRAATEVQRRSR